MASLGHNVNLQLLLCSITVFRAIASIVYSIKRRWWIKLVDVKIRQTWTICIVQIRSVCDACQQIPLILMYITHSLRVSWRDTNQVLDKACNNYGWKDAALINTFRLPSGTSTSDGNNWWASLLLYMWQVKAASCDKYNAIWDSLTQ